MSKSTLVKSTMVLTIATLLSKVLGSIFRVPLQNIAGDEVLGIFSLVYPVYMVALYLSVAGIPLAISQLIAKAQADGRLEDVPFIYKTVRILSLLFGFTSFLVIYLFSTPIANALGGPATRPALIIVSFTLIIAPYMAIYRGYFQGFGDMKPTAISQVIEQFVRVGVILVLAYYLVIQDFSNDVVAGGVMVGSVLGATASLVYLKFTYKRFSSRAASGGRFSFQQFKLWSKRVLKLSIPIAIGSITMALMNVVDAFTIPFGLRLGGVADGDVNYLYGIYGRGLAIVQIATVFATSVVLPIVPLITSKLAKGDHIGIRNVIDKIHRLTHLIAWPVAFGLLALTVPINLALFTNTEGSMVLAIINLGSAFISLTIVGTGILQGLNLARHAAWIILIGVVMKMVANVIFVPMLGLHGAAIATLLVYMILFAMNTILIYRKQNFTVYSKNVGLMIILSIIMGVIVGVPNLSMSFEAWNRWEAAAYILLASVIGGLFYLLSLYGLKVITKKDLHGLPLIGKRWKKED
ncbi:putative polysaccharide biosynthesis protein [Oceanobacillus senegalensis]|uniref:putative polysaccharide biosynthesis protein n=1 Tax=Oceanobacillus senegalensis TaxID=1936063 RepID=UPI000A30FA69|nr:polysaccharide biosynthesis protein [Oceanobacillus senegalensis]